jgi:hypothetical protein
MYQLSLTKRQPCELIIETIGIGPQSKKGKQLLN